MEQEKCPVCKLDNQKISKQVSKEHDIIVIVECHRCGTFVTPYFFYRMITKSSPEYFQLLNGLSSYIRQENEKGVSPPVVTECNWKDFAQLHTDAPALQKYNKLLKFIASRSSYHGEQIVINTDLDYPAIDAISSSEIEYFIGELFNNGYITSLREKSYIYYVAITMKGWGFIEQYADETNKTASMQINITDSNIGVLNPGEIKNVESLTLNVPSLAESGVLRSEPQQPIFDETPSAWKSSSFLQDGALVARSTMPRGDALWKNEPQAFLRLIPTSSTFTWLPFALLKLIQESRLAPFGSVPGWTSERNEYGAVVFHRETPVHHISQVFKNGELWGISRLWDISEWWHGNQTSIPSAYVEEEFEKMFASYLQFAHEKLRIPLPLRFIAGLSDVKGFRMLLSDGTARGNVIEDEIIYKGTVNNYTTPVQLYLRPFFDLIWNECGLERPSNLRGQP